MNIQEALTRKVGPLPVWAYGAVVAVAVWVYFYLQTGREEGNGATDGFPNPDVVDVANSGVWDAGGTGSSNVGGNGNGSAIGGTPSSNQAWYQLSASFLVGFGYEGVTVANALTKYLQGSALTVTERGLVSQAIARYGVPPEGVPPSEGGTVPPPTPGRPGTPVPPRIISGFPGFDGRVRPGTVLTPGYEGPMAR